MEILTLQSEVSSALDAPMKKLTYRLQRPGSAVTIEVGARYMHGESKKDVLCVPTQTNCAQACTFCHTTGLRGKVPVTNLSAFELEEIVRRAWIDSGMAEHRDHPLLVSFMGAGEPIANWRSLLTAMCLLLTWASKTYVPIRFGLATMLPKQHLADFSAFTAQIANLHIPLKVHFSMHYTTDAERVKYMPTAADLKTSLDMIEYYREITGNPVEIHYVLIAGSNDTFDDVRGLVAILKESKIPVKFLEYNPVPGDDRRSPDADWIGRIVEYLGDHGIPAEYFDSPGKDIFAACGRFAIDSYLTPDTDASGDQRAPAQQRAYGAGISPCSAMGIID
jgi:23S rRNA (adenine2503-C2)-methyltransferase